MNTLLFKLLNPRLKHAVLKMNAATMSEVRKYPQPPRAVHDVIIATTLLLGDPEELSRVTTSNNLPFVAKINFDTNLVFLPSETSFSEINIRSACLFYFRTGSHAKHYSRTQALEL